jgi:hypothetical protein
MTLSAWPEWLRLFAGMALMFGGSLLFAYACCRLVTRLARRLPRLEPGAVLSIRAASGVYRTRLERATVEGWIVAAPLQEDRYVPLRPGEAVYVEAPTPKGVLRFKSAIVARQADPHRFLIQTPRRGRIVERRTEPRDGSVEGQRAVVAGHPAELRNISPGGAAFAMGASLVPGDRVRVSVPGLYLEEDAWVLRVSPGVFEGRLGAEVRVCFAEAPRNRKGKRAPRWRGL